MGGGGLRGLDFNDNDIVCWICITINYTALAALLRGLCHFFPPTGVQYLVLVSYIAAVCSPDRREGEEDSCDNHSFSLGNCEPVCDCLWETTGKPSRK